MPQAHPRVLTTPEGKQETWNLIKTEEWAKDVYEFMSKKYGEDNIIGFYVHLDEMNPHIHCTLVPVDAEKNRISWRNVFGQNMKEESFNMTKLHSELERIQA